MSWQHKFLTRRELLARTGMGMGAVAMQTLLQGSTTSNPMTPRQPPLPAKAKRVLHLFMNGGPSHVDTFDPKPSLTKYSGKPIPSSRPTERKTGAAFGSPFPFKKYGKSGIEVSEIFANVGDCVDDLCVIRSM